MSAADGRCPRGLGKLGEEYAAGIYRRRGYEILARNYCVRGGELDIVAANDGFLVFVEVKTRREGSISTPSESVTAAKRRRLSYAANAYLGAHPEALNQVRQPRFDVVEIYAREGRLTRFRILENAFFSEG